MTDPRVGAFRERALMDRKPETAGSMAAWHERRAAAFAPGHELHTFHSKTAAYLREIERKAMPTDYSMFPQYRCHKIVRAMKIVDVIDRMTKGTDRDMLVLDNGSRVARAEVQGKLPDGSAPIGGYLVVYENVGRPGVYVSWSPGPEFEAGYSLLEEDPRAELKAEATTAWAKHMERVRATEEDAPKILADAETAWNKIRNAQATERAITSVRLECLRMASGGMGYDKQDADSVIKRARKLTAFVLGQAEDGS